jgi:hypothetical protein
MKKLSADAFFTEAYGFFRRYSEDNSWFGWQKPGDAFDLSAPVTYIFAAFAAYEKVCGNKMKTLILGDTKLRTDEDLVANFGLSSARGIQGPDRNLPKDKYDEELKALEKFVTDMTNRREKEKSPEPVVPAPVWKPDAKVTKAIPFVGSGSILSTAKWSPMLNDSFILGGAHQECEFFLGLGAEEAAIFSKLAASDSAQELWRNYFNANAGTLWNSSVNGGTGVPRVLLRELIGLKTFGYEPQFDKRQLGFKIADKGAADGATIGGYLDTLKANGFDEFKKQKLIALIGTYLFDDAAALKV